MENSFEIVVNKFMLFRKPIVAKPENVEHIRAALVLHNMLIQEDSLFYSDNQKLVDHFDKNGNLIEGAWRNEHRTDFFR